MWCEVVCNCGMENVGLTRCDGFFFGRSYEVGVLDYGVALFVLVGILFLSDVVIVIFCEM